MNTHLIIALIIAGFLFLGLIAWLLAEILKAPIKEVSKPADFMTPSEQEALENKARLQREMHQRRRQMKFNLKRRMQSYPTKDGDR